MKEALRNINDELLWDHYRNGDENCFTELFRRHYRKLLHYGLKLTPDRQQAEDCIQELMIRLWTRRQTVNTTESVKYYLFKAYRHILFRKLRQTRVYAEKTDDMDDFHEDISVEEALIRDESKDLLESKVKLLLNQLTPRQREILYLRFYQNLTPPEIASLLGINAQSVSNIIQRAFIKIREFTPNTTYNSFISVIAVILFLIL